MKKSFTLRLSLASSFVLVVLLTCGLIIGFTYFNLSKFARADLRNHMSSLVGVSSHLIDGEFHSKVQTPEDENGDTYRKLKAKLKSIRENTPGLRFVYTFRKDREGKILFVVDSEENPEEMSHVGDVYDEPTPDLISALDNPRVVVENDFSADKWGSWLSAFAPIYRKDGSFEALLGMDMSAASVLEYERKYLSTIIVISVLVSIVVALLGLYLAKSISHPLNLLTKDLDQMQNLKLDTRELLYSFVKEVNEMELAIQNLKKGLRSFKKYVPSDLVIQLFELKKEAVLEAEKKQLTIFFSDIANFTTISEQLGVDELAKRLGEYFEIMSSSIIQRQGSVDKYIGDAVMAFWGAPRENVDHARFACLAALDCQQKLEQLFAQWKTIGLPPMETRIGINTGEVVVGNIGYKERLSYTVLGDQVNLASRLEGLNKYYHTKIIISEETMVKAGPHFLTRILDTVVVKGKTEGAKVYELLGERDKQAKDTISLADEFNAAMALYYKRDWKASEQAFSTLAKDYPGDRPVSVMLERCKKFVDTPPAADWTGAIVMREK